MENLVIIRPCHSSARGIADQGKQIIPVEGDIHTGVGEGKIVESAARGRKNNDFIKNRSGGTNVMKFLREISLSKSPR